jgi:hypothetical protein
MGGLAGGAMGGGLMSLLQQNPDILKSLLPMAGGMAGGALPMMGMGGGKGILSGAGGMGMGAAPGMMKALTRFGG